MSYRYSEREIEFFDSMVITARRVARMGGAPIEPDKTDYEAIEFLIGLESAAADITRDDYDVAYEIADNEVPYNDYKAAMAYAQLGLYGYDDMVGDSTYAGDQMKTIRYALYNFGYNYVTAYMEESM